MEDGLKNIQLNKLSNEEKEELEHDMKKFIQGVSEIFPRIIGATTAKRTWDMLQKKF